MYLQYLPLPHKRDYTLTIPQELKLRTASHSSAWYPWELAHPGAARETNKHSIKILFKGAIIMYLQGDEEQGIGEGGVEGQGGPYIFQGTPLHELCTAHSYTSE